ncbi:hypothetical protein C3B55_00254 [Candidatus Pseudomonas adelgestsugas]|uniref:Secreted protein n=1 Tax=Candidatus Pseudomonas adelgestsugas TaxID=1302376 RepID=A0ABX5R8V8_9PSED|nr:hypothetical protein C3B55_00254 [Candidatus Pseudomonas adelgestsugas]
MLQLLSVVIIVGCYFCQFYRSYTIVSNKVPLAVAMKDLIGLNGLHCQFFVEVRLLEWRSGIPVILT